MVNPLSFRGWRLRSPNQRHSHLAGWLPSRFQETVWPLHVRSEPGWPQLVGTAVFQLEATIGTHNGLNIPDEKFTHGHLLGC